MTESLLIRLRLSLEILTERRALLLVVVDGVFLLIGVFQALFGRGNAEDFWIPTVISPLLFVAVPTMADAVAVERRSGTLDLALSSPGARFYFERRIAAVVAIAIIQSVVAVLFARLVADAFPLTAAIGAAIVSALFLGAVTLNWCVRLKTSGAVIFAVYVTVVAFGPWFFSMPIYPRVPAGPMTAAQILEWTKCNLILLAAAAGAYAYALQRLSRPETMLI